MKRRIAFFVLACLIASESHADELKIMSPVALKPVLTSIAEAFEKSSGDRIEFVWSESGKINADIASGTPFTIAVLTPNFVEALTKQGKLDAATRTPVARSGIGVAIRKGAAKPDVSTTEAFKRMLLEAKSIGFVDQSATSRYVTGLFARLGIAEQVKDKLRPLHGTAAQFVAKGDPEIALTQIATILPFDGVDFAGPLPPDLQLYTVFTAVAAPGANPAKVQTLLKAMVAPEHVPALRAIGLEPPG
jgi:molybdate transport system substrate-binding protein